MSVTSTSGMINYAPGASKHFTVTVAGTGGTAGFLLTARPASNLTGGVAGNLVAGATTQVLCRTGTACAAGNPQYIRSVSATATPATFDFDWTAPAGTEDVTLYIAGAVGYRGNTYTATYLLKASTTGPPPTLSVAPANLSFSSQVGGASPPSQTLAISGAATTYSATASGGTWLSLSPASGGTSGSASVSVNTAGLAAGSYAGSVVITAAGSTGSPVTVPVTLNVTAAAPTLTVNPASLAFAYQIGGTVPAAQALSISGAASTYTAAASGGTWLSVSPASGGASGSASVAVNTAGLAAGTYSGSVTITAAGSAGSPKTVPVTLTVTTGTPGLTVSPASLTFTYRIGGTAPAAQTLNIGGVTSTFTAAASGGAWLSVTTASSSASVAVNAAGLAAGTYSGSVTITAPGTTGSPKIVPVTLNVTDTASTLTVSPSSLAFSYHIGEDRPASQTIRIGGAATTYTAAASGGSWLSVSPASGGTSGSVRVTVNTSGLAEGTYTGAVTITAPGSGGSPNTVPVTLIVTSLSHILTVSPAALTFAYQVGGTAPPAQTLRLRGVATTYTAVAAGGAWLSVTPASGGASSNPTVSVNTVGLAAGTYTGSVTITAPRSAGSPNTVPVTLTVTPPPPTLTVSPTSLAFAYHIGDPSASSQSLSISAGSLNFTAAASGASWLIVAPASGTSPGVVSVAVNATGLGVGTYTGTVTITAPGSVNTTQIVAVDLTVAAPTLVISPAALSFSYAEGGPTPVAQAFSVASSGTALNYTVTTSGETWLSAAPIGGVSPGTLFISVNTANLVAGAYKASVTITPLSYPNNPQTVPVTLTVTTGTPICPAP